MTILRDLTFSRLQAHLEAAGQNPAHARAIFQALHQQHWPEDHLVKLPGLPVRLRAWLTTRPAQPEPQEIRQISSTDGLTRKFLLRLHDGVTIETVLMTFSGRHTACVSTQAGCAMGCIFCATGQAGFTRHLTPGEIIAQVIHLQRALRQQNLPPLRNIVLMGMGEPLHNFEAVMDALEILTDTRAHNLGPSRITLSTVGHVPGIRQLARERFRCHLAVSLHAATQEARAELIPIARRWPLEELMDALREYVRLTERRIFIEWTLIRGENDRPEDAATLAQLLRGLPCHVNLIPLNPTPAFCASASQPERVWEFQRKLRTAGFPCTIRQRRGIDVAAGCGQLAASAREQIKTLIPAHDDVTDMPE